MKSHTFWAWVAALGMTTLSALYMLEALRP